MNQTTTQQYQGLQADLATAAQRLLDATGRLSAEVDMPGALQTILVGDLLDIVRMLRRRMDVEGDPEVREAITAFCVLGAGRFWMKREADGRPGPITMTRPAADEPDTDRYREFECRPIDQAAPRDPAGSQVSEAEQATSDEGAYSSSGYRHLMSSDTFKAFRAECANRAQPVPEPAATPPAGGQERPVLEWQPLTKPGQIKKGDALRFTCGDKAFTETARLILEPGTNKEEVVYNLAQNFYFITSMAIKGTSSHKGVEFIAAKQAGKEPAHAAAADQGGR